MTIVADRPVQTIPHPEPLSRPAALPVPTTPSDGARLAHWIREGSRGTVQVFGTTFAPPQGACALGALYWGLKGHDAEPDFIITELSKATDIDLARSVTHPERSYPMPLFRLIVSLNDEYRWSREDIANWLEANIT